MKSRSEYDRHLARLLFRRHEALQLLEPVENHVDLGQLSRSLRARDVGINRGPRRRQPLTGIRRVAPFSFTFPTLARSPPSLTGDRLGAPRQQGERFEQGDRIIRATLVELAAEKELSHQGIELRESHPGIYVYSLRGTRKSIALREREIRYAAEPETLARFVTPRLRAVFKDIWWEKALVLMGVKNK